MRNFVFAVLVAAAAVARGAERFEINEGERVLFMGDTVIEREGSYGFFETQMRLEFAGRKFAVRNLGFSGDSPLGSSRVSFDPNAKGVARIQEQLALVKPTVAFLGYGMASSLEALTQINHDTALNPDIARYGTNHNAAAFKADMEKLMDLIVEASPEQKVRFVLVAPLAHVDVRKQKPGSPDPAQHNKLLAEYGAAIEALAKERGTVFVRADFGSAKLADCTVNGIHPTEAGWAALAGRLAEQLGWKNVKAQDAESLTKLRSAIQKKNEQFFHRWRPANETYLLGFRKHEQGRNAAELPKFDPIVEAAEAELVALAVANDAKPLPPPAPSKLVIVDPQPVPVFTKDAGIEVSIFAENPMMEKPTQMNWDSRGRLWVASSGVYPQIEPGVLATDKILILEDTNHDGKAEKSTIFADGLLMPTAVAPDGRGGCYVGASTELLHFSEPDANGRATKKRIVMSAFGTEDTHHIIHTLHWGVDGKLYFHQSIYIHSHVETPWGLVRANAGAVFAYDPITERLEVFNKGLVNSWGQQEDRYGQMFLTDGAGGNGISWGFPGSVFPPSEGARLLTHSISPGSYPKFCALEIVNSPAFPDDWQDNFITCDFRAHRIVRFSNNDLSRSEKPQSGYVTKDMPDVLRTSDAAFRPIDVRVGPDGALYIADWSNPIINHGEVDFRDPRRDHHRGRIWRLTYAGRPVTKWEPVAGKKLAALNALLTSPSRWEREQARREIYLAGETPDPKRDEAAPLLALRSAKQDELIKLTTDANPRTRLEAVRALARIPDAKSAAAVLEAAVANSKAQPTDDFLTFALWRSVNDLAKPWSDAVVAETWKAEGREEQLAFAMKIIDPVYARPVAAAQLRGKAITTAEQIELIERNGGPPELRKLFDAVMADQLGTLRQRGINALVVAAQTREARPEGDVSGIGKFFDEQNRDLRAAAARLSGLWKLTGNASRIAALAAIADDAGLRGAGFEGLRYLGQKQTVDELKKLVAADRPAAVRRGALAVQAHHDLPSAIANIQSVFSGEVSENEALETWRAFLKAPKAADTLAKNPSLDLPPAALTACMKAAKEMGYPGRLLLQALGNKGTAPAAAQNVRGEIDGMVAAVAKGGDPAQGEMVYKRIGCAACHAIGGAGGKLGPDMSSLGASAPVDYIVESVLDPASKVKEGYHAFAYVMKDGTRMVGIPSRETANQQFIQPAPGVEIPVFKENIASRETAGSLMPAGLVNSLDYVEKRSLFAFMAQIGKPGPFDASKGNVARVWWLYPEADTALAKTGANPEKAIAAYTLIDGRLTRELISGPPLSITKGSYIAVAKFTAPTKTEKPLVLTGAKAAWLDGQAVTLDAEGRIAAGIPAGPHVIAVALDAAKPPAALHAQCDDARFIGD